MTGGVGPVADGPVGGARLLGLGSYRPQRTVTAEEVGRRFGRSEQWVLARTGFATRRVAGPDETLVGMALAAARDALADSGRPAHDVDLVIVATCTTGPAPGVIAGHVAAGLGVPGAAAVDLNAACAGFCYGLAAAADSVRAGTARCALVVAAERMSDILDPDDLGTAVIFGDGAGAAVVGPAEPGEPAEIGPVAWGNDGARADLIELEPASQRLRMQGQAVFRWATENIARVALAACERAGVTPTDLAAVVPHQANLRIVNSIAGKLGVPDAVVARDGAESGNTSAASIPLALDRLREQKAVQAGDLALLVGYGAGLTWAAQVVRVP